MRARWTAWSRLPALSLASSFLTCHFTVSLLEFKFCGDPLVGQPTREQLQHLVFLRGEHAFPLGGPDGCAPDVTASDAASTRSMNAARHGAGGSTCMRRRTRSITSGSVSANTRTRPPDSARDSASINSASGRPAGSFREQRLRVQGLWTASYPRFNWVASVLARVNVERPCRPDLRPPPPRTCAPSRAPDVSVAPADRS